MGLATDVESLPADALATDASVVVDDACTSPACHRRPAVAAPSFGGAAAEDAILVAASSDPSPAPDVGCVATLGGRFCGVDVVNDPAAFALCCSIAIPFRSFK